MGRRRRNRKKGKHKVIGFKPQWAQDLDEVYNDMINLPGALKGKKGGGQGGYHGLGYYGGGGNTVVYRKCEHPGDKVIFEHEGKKLFASNRYDIKPHSGKWNLIIDLANVVDMPDLNGFVKSGNPSKFDVLKKYTLVTPPLPCEVLRLDWADMGAPKARLGFWLTLWKLLPEKTVVACFGGHGRTGTCLAALIIAAGIDFYSAVEAVRTEHCSEAIESMSQMDYLHALYVAKLQMDLEAAIKAGDKAEQVDIQEDLKYAEQHKPVMGDSKQKKV